MPKQIKKITPKKGPGSEEAEPDVTEKKPRQVRTRIARAAIKPRKKK